MQIGVVRQEPTMFSGSISDNIRLAKPSATDAEIEAVCKLANAHDFIMKFPEVLLLCSNYYLRTPTHIRITDEK